jgi:hypothetical protein
MPRIRKAESKPVRIVQYDFENRTYQIDPGRNKVYRRFVEIETAKACAILASWRAAATV